MPKEISAGMIVYNPKMKKFLVLEYESHWGFVKGHIEDNEREEETARRELKEETGIEEFNFASNFKEKIDYFYKKENKTVYKEVIFFLILTKTEDVKLSNEHKSYKWADFKEAHKLVKFKNTREVLKKAEEFIEKNL
ncbi:NUDIX domain-containing protein [Candidatus Woesearchaeota archaeon]|nr:NUDIX domain-containing protein [Candidatus Woesearchaeota archaeon]